MLYAELFEQLMLYDKIAIKIDRFSLGLHLLIKELGLVRVEELIEKDIIELVLWKPIIVSSTGTAKEDRSIDNSTIFGQPPLATGYHSDEDFNTEANIDKVLNAFNFRESSKSRFKQKALKQFRYPNLDIAEKSSEIVIDAYTSNKLKNLNLPFEKDPGQLNLKERAILFKLGSDVLTTTVLADLNILSNNNYAHISLINSAVKDIERALEVEKNNSEIFQIENIPTLKSLILEKEIRFNDVFLLRDKRIAQEYRNWLHKVSDRDDAYSITKEYINEITGKNNFFESNKGKILRTVGMYGLGTGIAASISGLAGAISALFLVRGAELGLGLFDSFVLDGLLKGWNPRMFTEEVDKLRKLEN
ncbi:MULTISPECIES: hypothetical protein [Flavobacteriaceae]|uniref:hypothetical protein n=1 Tax=Flavobacteriaceae TaxID=49546 RepID=UPI001490CD82|nr:MULTISPECIES: hypothetical protein [Allomuricauda]MDC6364869.1 hypothetical protein [Muricauda sp. AC10]